MLKPKNYYCQHFCSWFISAPEEKGPPIPIPPLKSDKYRRSTVLPYLDAYHYETDRDLEEVYFTEHDLNRMFIFYFLYNFILHY